MSIELKGLTHIYNATQKFEKYALDNVSLTIEKGSFTGLIGHTGSGKSTLIQHLNGLLKPTSGTILLDGVDINADKSQYKRLRQRVGLVFQYPEHQLFELSIYKDVAFGPENMGLSKEEIDLRVREALSITGVPEDMYNKSPFDLSGGQKRRVAIAGVLAMRPEVLVLDEPTAGLDPHGRDEILDKIKEMHEQLKITVILVSHSMEDISRLVQKIIVMNNGKVAYNGTPSEVFIHAKELEQIGLAAPQISYLMQSLNERGIKMPTDVFTVNSATETIYHYLKGAKL